jgi:adenylosuccinate lyase
MSDSLKNTLYAISPIDGRYNPLSKALQPYFSEYALMRYRTEVEIRWLMHLASIKTIDAIPALNDTEQKNCLQWIKNFNTEDAEAIKAHEAICQHDLKAIEYHLRDKCNAHNMKTHGRFIHFCCTSEDINNLAYSLMIRDACAHVITPHLTQLKNTLAQQANAYKSLVMLARTHGQRALPTTLGKEYALFAMRLHEGIQALEQTQHSGKCNGAVGNYHAHTSAYPNIDWPKVSEDFVTGLGLSWQSTTTQIEPQDNRARLLHNMVSINSILSDLSRDFWLYLSFGYFQNKADKNQVGSSTMPHKINPIHFENAEGNLGISSALLQFMAQNLPQSRLQRDLSGSTIQRNIGVAFAHSQIAISMIEKGLSKLTPNIERMKADCLDAYDIMGEAVQTILKRAGHDDAYDTVRVWTQGKTINASTFAAWIDSLAIDPKTKQELKALKPETHTGLAEKIVTETLKKIKNKTT